MYYSKLDLTTENFTTRKILSQGISIFNKIILQSLKGVKCVLY